MSEKDAEDRVKRVERAKKRCEPAPATSTGVAAKRDPVMPSSPPREIVVYCEGFGAGAGLGWFTEVSFVEWSHGGYSVFLRTDEDPYDEGSMDDDGLEEDSLDAGTEDAPTRGRQIATVKEPLTWRRVLRFASRRRCLRISDDSADIRVDGVEPYQRDVITSAMMRNYTRGRRNLSSFLSGLPDDDLRSLHGWCGGLLSEKADEVLPGLAGLVLQAGLKGKSFQELAELVGITGPWDLEVLMGALHSHGEAANKSEMRDSVMAEKAKKQKKPTSDSAPRRLTVKEKEDQFYRHFGGPPVAMTLPRKDERTR
jgi:hypothetical protein